MISLVIIALLVLQTIASFNLTFGPIERSPFLYPFLDYPMYQGAHYKGETIDEYFIVGILEDSSEVPILPEDLGFDNVWLYRKGFVRAVLRGNQARIKDYAELYKSKQNEVLIGLRVEIHPVSLSRVGVEPGPPRVIIELQLESAVREM